MLNNLVDSHVKLSLRNNQSELSKIKDINTKVIMKDFESQNNSKNSKNDKLSKIDKLSEKSSNFTLYSNESKDDKSKEFFTDSPFY